MTKDGGSRSWMGDWHAIGQAIFQGVEGSELETMYYKELHQASYLSNLETSDFERSKGLRYRCVRSGQRAEDPNKTQVRVDLWAIHLQRTTSALADALKRTEQKCGRARSSVTSDV